MALCNTKTQTQTQCKDDEVPSHSSQITINCEEKRCTYNLQTTPVSGEPCTRMTKLQKNDEDFLQGSPVSLVRRRRIRMSKLDTKMKRIFSRAHR
jgi:hypothetical protein